MAEALGVAASVAGLVSLALQTTEYLYKYYSAYKDRDDDLSRTTRRLSDLLQSLGVIDDVLRTRTWRSDEKTTLRNIENAINQSEDMIQDLQDEVRKFRREPTSNSVSTMRAVGRRAAYPFRKGTLAKLDEDVGAFSENLIIALQALHLKEHQNTQRDIEEAKDIIKNIQAHHLATGLRQWLKAPDATIEYNAACAKRHAGTGQWLVHGSNFTTWLQRDNSFLWLYGFAGCGKSVLCSTAVQHTFRQQRSLPGSAIAFFFFTFSDESKRDASAFLRAFLLQLSGQVSGVDVDLRRLQDSTNHGTPSVLVLMECLRQAVERSRHVYILLDALDECPSTTARQDVLTTIHNMRQWSLPGLHLLVTSRDLPDIRDHLHLHGPANDSEIVFLNHENVQHDIQDYVAYKIDHDTLLRRWGDHRDKIKTHLVQRAKGVFRWVECQLEPLRHCARSVKYLEKRLNALPESLDETYARMLCDIDVEARDEAQRMLALLCCSARPMLVDEVIDALAVDIHEDAGFDVDRRFEGADDLLRICPGMIEINLSEPPDEGDRYDNEDGSESSSLIINRIDDRVVRIAHFSVQEYLMSDRIHQSRAVDFAVTESRDHARISCICLLYLRNDGFLGQTLTPDLVRQYPFAKFAADHWCHHYERGDRKLAERRRVIEVLTNSAILDRWIMLHDPMQPWRTRISYDLTAVYHPTATYYASWLGLDDVLAGILAISHDNVNTEEGTYGTALIAASVHGFEEVVQTLLDNGARVDAQAYFSNALMEASRHGHKDLVQMLLDNGAHVNAQNAYHGPALYEASLESRKEIVQSLLENGADVNIVNESYGTALIAASSYGGDEEIVQILLDNGADVNLAGNHSGFALREACRHGRKKIVQMLLEHGADVNAIKVYYSPTALYAAAKSDGGQDEIVKILLHHGADINKRAHPSDNPLSAAAFNGNANIVRMLLNEGANVDGQEKFSDNPLSFAVLASEQEVLQILLQHGAKKGYFDRSEWVDLTEKCDELLGK